MRIVNPFLTKINKYDFQIPLHGKVKMLVGRGDKVKKGDHLFQREYKKILASYSVTKDLGISPKDAKEYTVRLNGEYVTVGEILAERLTSGGLIVKKIFATVEGLLSLDRLDEGFIDILSEHTVETVESNMYGTVSDIDLSRSITIESHAYQLNTVLTAHGVDTEGDFYILGDGNSVYSQRSINEDIEGKIVFAGRFLYAQTATEILKKGAIAIVTWSMDWNDYTQFKNKIVVVGGFGQIPYDQMVSHAIAAFNGSHILISENKIIMADVGQYLLKDINPGIESQLKVNQIVKVSDPDNYYAIAKVVEAASGLEYATIVYNNGQRALISEEMLTPIY